tara:strand:+ start:7326 stop:7766 length:441 start_codon:yes stop_codon:yes gene_type:complete
MDTNNKRTGSVAELAVSAKLVSLGYNVSLPFGELPYDIVAEKDGKLIRVQVKSATLSKYGSYRCSLTHGSGSKKMKYTSESCDLMILYAPYSEDYTDIPDDGFYVIPIKELLKRNAYHAILHPAGRGKGNRKICKWEEFRDGWKKI